MFQEDHDFCSWDKRPSLQQMTRNGALDPVTMGDGSELLPPHLPLWELETRGNILDSQPKYVGTLHGKDGLCTLSLLPPVALKILHGDVPSLCS